MDVSAIDRLRDSIQDVLFFGPRRNESPAEYAAAVGELIGATQGVPTSAVAKLEGLDGPHWTARLKLLVADYPPDYGQLQAAERLLLAIRSEDLPATAAGIGSQRDVALDAGTLANAKGMTDPLAADDPLAEVLEPQDKALALLVSHPEWSDAKIADAVGVSRTTLYKSTWRKYQQAREALKAGRQAVARGGRDAETGSVEAWGSDE